MSKNIALREAQVPETVTPEDSAQIARARAEVESGVILAKRFPRDETRARLAIEKSLDRLAFAEDCYYSFPRAKTEIFGPSINFAREFARQWGNIRYGYHSWDADSDDKRTVTAFAWDLETNAYTESQDTFEKLIQRKDFNTQTTAWVTPDERDLRELTERRAAIQVRNCLLRLAPRDLVDECVEKARQIVKAGQDSMPIEQRRVQCVKAFETIGIYGGALEGYLGHPIDEATPDEIAELRGIWKAIKDGVSDRSEYFGAGGGKKKDAPAEKPAMTLDQAAGGTVIAEPESKPARKLSRVEKRQAIQIALMESPDVVLSGIPAYLQKHYGVKDVTMLMGDMVDEAYEKIVVRKEID